MHHPLLADAERRRTQSADVASLESAARRGIRLERRSALPTFVAENDTVVPALFIEGEIAALHAPTIAIVGTRTASGYGRACAMKFAEAFARAGVTVVSGGAVGIDAAAHGAAIEAGGKTAAVLAGGIDLRYPAINFGLFERIVANGCLVSEFALGSKPDQYKFIVRNRLIAALSSAVLVIEAPAKSGALHTAVAAAEFGREVFVIPAAIDFMSFRGSLGLIRDGATMVFHPDQVLEPLNIRPIPVVKKPRSGPTTDSELVLDALSSTPLVTEKIVELTGLETSVVLGELTMLELDGVILREAGGFIKKL